MRQLPLVVADVVGNGNCCGCGACTQMTSGLEMSLSSDGFLRPTPNGDSGNIPDDFPVNFKKVCPGVTLVAPSSDRQRQDLLFGPVKRVYVGWAADATLRHSGSSGGVLTALAKWLVESGGARGAVVAQPDKDDPLRTVSRAVESADEIVAAAGSRYAPVATISTVGATDPAYVVTGKPCEVSALRSLAAVNSVAPPILLSFFCAGVPSQHATEKLVRQLGFSEDERIVSLRYRGDGWPGLFKVTSASDKVAEYSYEESWGKHLGRSLQWRCKICPDGVGEHADIVAGDFWKSDESGYPKFSEMPGQSIIIARSDRGAELLDEAVSAGVIVAASEADHVSKLARVQPLQRDRRRFLAARLLGVRLAGGVVPKYSGFGLVGLSMRCPVRSVRTVIGTLRRYGSVRARLRP